MLDLDFQNENLFSFAEPDSKRFCSAWVATAIVGGSVIGGLATAYSANKAAGAQTNAANQAQQTALGMYNTTRGDLDPYRQIGKTAGDQLTGRLGELTSPISVNPQDFVNSDMYKFQAYQGRKAVENSAAARGLGVSGAALKGGINFANNLASTNWQQNFQNQQTNQANAFNRLKSLVDTGENASAQTGTLGTAAANTAASAQIGAGNAQAAGYNAIGGAVSGLGNNIAGLGLYKGIYGGGGNGSPGNFGGSPSNNSLLNPATYGNV